MKVSVLVAVYNAERYLPQCLESLVNQTHEEVEIICIDDASTDGSWAMLQQYAARDERIVVLRQEVNQGQAHARNRGLEVATGDYITMVDSDDWLAPDALAKAVEVAGEDERNDCVLLDVRYHDETSGKEWGYTYRTAAERMTGEEAFRLSLDWSIHGLYLVRRDIQLAYPYDTTCRLYSDDNTTRMHFLHARQVKRCGGVYYYRQHAASMTHAVSVLRFQYIEANRSMKEQMRREEVDEKLVNLYEEYRWLNLVGMYVFYWTNRKRLGKEERRNALKILREAYRGIELERLSDNVIRKFGYYPCGHCRPAFELESWLYTRIRQAYYRMRGWELPSGC